MRIVLSFPRRHPMRIHSSHSVIQAVAGEVRISVQIYRDCDMGKLTQECRVQIQLIGCFDMGKPLITSRDPISL